MMIENHGVEYRVQLKPNSDHYDVLAKYISKYKKNAIWSDIIVVANTKQTDNRLLSCKYYNDRKTTWFKDFLPKNCKLTNIDIDLTEEEKDILNFILHELGDQVIDHGWFEIWTVY